MSVFRKATVGLALAVSVAAFSKPAHAVDPILNFGGEPSAITFTGGTLSANTLTTVTFLPGVASDITGVRFTMTTTLNGPGTPLGGSNFAIGTGIGTFAYIVDPVANPLGVDIDGDFIIDYAAGSTILSGSFTAGTLTRFGSSMAFTADNFPLNLIYDGSGWAEQLFNIAHNGGYPYPLVGSMSLSITDVSQLPTLAGSGLSNDFDGQVSGNLDAVNAVPEPGEWAAMGILASGLTGLMVRARRRHA